MLEKLNYHNFNTNTIVCWKVRISGNWDSKKWFFGHYIWKCMWLLRLRTGAYVVMLQVKRLKIAIFFVLLQIVPLIWIYSFTLFLRFLLLVLDFWCFVNAGSLWKKIQHIANMIIILFVFHWLFLKIYEVLICVLK